MRGSPQTLTLLLVLFLLGTSSSALAKGQKHTYWHLTSDAGEEAGKEFESQLRSVLVQAEGTHHTTEGSLAELLDQKPLKVPSCFEGAKLCTTVPELLVEALGVDGLVEGRISAAADGYQVELTLYREFGGTPKVVTRSGADLEGVVRDAVGALFTLEAAIKIYTEPAGASVFVNGNLVGESPTRVQVHEGNHGLRLEKEGYEVLREDLTVLPGEVREYNATLVPKVTQITVITWAESAAVYVDGKLSGASGAPIDVMPGAHSLELRANGYRPIEITFDIAAAQRRTIQLAMLKEVEDPWARREQAIRTYRLYVEAGYALTLQSIGFAGATADIAGSTYSPTSFGGEDRASLVFNGVKLAVGYTMERLGLVFLGVDLMVASMDSELILTAQDTARRESAVGQGASHIALYPLQGTFRELWGAFGAEAQTGLGVSFDSLNGDLTGDAFDLSQTAVFWSLAASGRYYLSEEWSLTLGYRMDYDFADQRGLRHGFFAGVGFNLPLLVDAGGESKDESLPEQLEEDVPVEGTDVPESTLQKLEQSGTEGGREP
ncbi:MAG: hypothetical protein CO108_04350 [Deltaproteobacteria bacterium CG_4_9_14_3_um_filter_63_12]|nr:MAG: hypothetical protein CO108_04350 [Deltaproteobacteria bacterium CG_4_9_14_3_um_filter_63_12]